MLILFAFLYHLCSTSCVPACSITSRYLLSYSPMCERVEGLEQNYLVPQEKGFVVTLDNFINLFRHPFPSKENGDNTIFPTE